MSVPAMSLKDWFSVSRKDGTGWYIYPKGDKSMAVCGLGCKSVCRVIAQIVLENSHLISQGLYAVFKYGLLARAG